MLGRALRLTAWGAAAAFLLASDVPLCPFALITRHPCPGCGLTRGAIAILHGDVAAALRFHPLSPVVAPLVAVALGWSATSYVRYGRWSLPPGRADRALTTAAATLAVALIAVWAARFLGALGGPVPV